MGDPTLSGGKTEKVAVPLYVPIVCYFVARADGMGSGHRLRDVRNLSQSRSQTQKQSLPPPIAYQEGSELSVTYISVFKRELKTGRM